MATTFRRRPRSTAAALSAVMALVLSGCSGGGGGTATTPGPADNEVSSFAAAFAALDGREQASRLASQAATVERQVLLASPMATDLGGPEKATAAYDAMTGALVAQARRYEARPPSTGRFGVRPRTGSETSLGTMMFVGMLLGGIAVDSAVTASNDAKEGAAPETTTNKDNSGNHSSQFTVGGSVDRATMDWTVQTTAAGVTGSVRIQFDINPCPGPDGTFTGTVRITMKSTSKAGSVGSNHTLSIKLTGRVDDDARLVGYDVSTNSEAAQFGSGNNVWAEVIDKESRTGDKITSYTRTVGRTAGTLPPDFAQQWGNAGMMTSMLVTDKMVQAARKAWESGRCVRLEPITDPGAKGLQPSTSVTITAAPRSKIDGGKVGGTVTGTLAGQTSLTPAGSKTPADATFTYVAPGEVGQRASVSLEARSRRGVAKAAIEFDTAPAAYDVTGSLASLPGGTTFTGRICDVTKPFKLTTAGDMIGTVSLTPTGATAGTLSYSGRTFNAPFPLSGRGSYTLTLPSGQGNGSMKLKWQTTLRIPGVGSRTNAGTVDLTLTPRTAC